jgi:hypothetical protein
MTREVVGSAKARLSAILRERHGKLGGPLDMEPWEVLVEFLRSARYDTLGGPPQLARIGRQSGSELLAVAWPSNDGRLALTGRTLLGYERTDALVAMPDAPWT